MGGLRSGDWVGGRHWVGGWAGGRHWVGGWVVGMRLARRVRATALPHCAVAPLTRTAHAPARAAPTQADAPDFSKIPPDDIVGVTIILLTCSYRSQARGAGRSCVRACVRVGGREGGKGGTPTAHRAPSHSRTPAHPPTRHHPPTHPPSPPPLPPRTHTCPSPPCPPPTPGVHPSGVLCEQRVCRGGAA